MISLMKVPYFIKAYSTMTDELLDTRLSSICFILNLRGNTKKFCYSPKLPYLDVYLVTEF
jgi:hypothetical protein